jgi:uncharacterized membrane-anchored protein YhcB (DUF1043 family)
MNKLKLWLVVALVFLAGFAAGVVTTRAVVRRMVSQAVLNPDRVRELIEKRITAKLGLDNEQQAKVHGVLAKASGELKDLRGDFQPRFRAIMSNAESEISAVLTPEQRERFKKFREENRHLWQPR